MATFVERADYWADQFGVPRDIYRRLVTRESNWNHEALNKGSKAYGLTQVRPDTARQPGYRVKPMADPMDPDEQLRFGAEYLGAMMRQHGGDTNKALAAYNWGVGNVEDWDGNWDSLPQETKDYIQFINPDHIIGRNLKDGTMTDDSLRGLVEGALDDAALQERLGGKPMPSGIVDPAQSAQAQAQNTGLLAKLMPNLSDADRRQNLLAIGAGLLSGDDWTSGIEGAGNALFQVGQARQARDEQAALLSQKGPAGGFERIGSVVTPEGQIVGGVSYDPTNADFFRIDENGKRVSIPGAIPLNNSDASGSRYATLAAKAADNVRASRQTLGTLEELMTDIEKQPAGIPKLVEKLDMGLKTILGKTNLTEEQIKLAVNEGRIQELVGQIREDVVGPGVMTEQDAMRVLAAVGGDFRSWSQNPAASKAILEDMYKRSLRKYNETHDQYDSYRSFPGSVFNPIERYTPRSGGTTGATGGVDDILSNYGL